MSLHGAFATRAQYEAIFALGHDAGLREARAEIKRLCDVLEDATSLLGSLVGTEHDSEGAIAAQVAECRAALGEKP